MRSRRACPLPGRACNRAGRPIARTLSTAQRRPLSCVCAAVVASPHVSRRSVHPGGRCQTRRPTLAFGISSPTNLLAALMLRTAPATMTKETRNVGSIGDKKRLTLSAPSRPLHARSNSVQQKTRPAAVRSPPQKQPSALECRFYARPRTAPDQPPPCIYQGR